MPPTSPKPTAAQIVNQLLAENEMSGLSASQVAQALASSFADSAPETVSIQSAMGNQVLTITEVWRDGDTLRIAVELPANAQ